MVVEVVEVMPMVLVVMVELVRVDQVVAELVLLLISDLQVMELMVWVEVVAEPIDIQQGREVGG